jgi:replicative DNA helicase
VVCDGDEEAWSTVVGHVPPDAFFLTQNRIVYEVLLAMRRTGQQIDGLTILAELQRRHQLEEIGGLPFIGAMLNAVPSWQHWKQYAAIVTDLYQRRRLLALSISLAAQAHLPPREMAAVDVAAKAQKQLAEIIESGTGGRYVSAGKMVEECFEKIGNGVASYVPSGFKELDRSISGFGFGEFWVVGARPSMGKSTFCRQLAVRIARMGIPVGFISLEESLEKMGRNLLAAESGIENSRIRSGFIGKEEWPELTAGVAQLANLPLWFTDSARRISDIRAMAAMMQAREKIQLLIIDYLQKIPGGRGGNRFETVTELSLEVSELAKTTMLAVVCPVQLNRALEGRDDKRPTMADIRESGQIEQDVDGIIFLHREDYYRQQKGSAERDGMAELFIAKNRDGIRGVKVWLKSDLKHQRFMDRNEADQPQEEAAYEPA